MKQRMIEKSKCHSRSLLQVLYKITAKRYNNRIMESLNIKNKLESSYILKLKDILKNAGIMSDISSQKVWLLYTFSCEESFASIPLPPVFQWI